MEDEGREKGMERYKGNRRRAGSRLGSRSTISRGFEEASSDQASNVRACELFAQSVISLIYDTRLGAP
jgi:hypothetical protein